jgi:hypothetical protein
VNCQGVRGGSEDSRKRSDYVSLGDLGLKIVGLKFTKKPKKFQRRSLREEASPWNQMITPKTPRISKHRSIREQSKKTPKNHPKTKSPRNRPSPTPIVEIPRTIRWRLAYVEWLKVYVVYPHAMPKSYAIGAIELRQLRIREQKGTPGETSRQKCLTFAWFYSLNSCEFHEESTIYQASSVSTVVLRSILVSSPRLNSFESFRDRDPAFPSFETAKSRFNLFPSPEACKP